mmetsp:Transcript_10045/g.22560  ORF Transcript_10045/g.22560 Transcript_10045/m.22560 type:complete len:285 (+) Transcript_10045:86-940(+)
MGDCIVCGHHAVDKDNRKAAQAAQETKKVWVETAKDSKDASVVQKTWPEEKDDLGTDAASTERHKSDRQGGDTGGGQLRITAAKGESTSQPPVVNGDVPSVKIPAAAQLVHMENGDTATPHSPEPSSPSPVTLKPKKPSRASRSTLSGYVGWKECTMADLADLFPDYYSLEGANTPWGFTPALSTLYHGWETSGEELGGDDSGSDGEASHSVCPSWQRSWNSGGSVSTESDEPFDLPDWLAQDTHHTAGEKRAPSREEASSFGSSSEGSPRLGRRASDSSSSGL